MLSYIKQYTSLNGKEYSREMIYEGKVAIASCISYILLVLIIFYDRRLKEVWDFATPCVIFGLGFSVTFFVPHSSVVKRAAAIGKL